MVTLILSILFWAKKDNKTLGIAAIAMGVIGSVLSCIMYGPVGFVDVAILVVNIIVFYINHIKKNDDDDSGYY